MAEKKKLCKYTNCMHDTREIKSGEEVKVSQSYYHKDCNAERILINQIIDVWKRSVDPHPIEKEVRRVINNIVKNYGVRPPQLLYHLVWCLNNGWNINHTNGLYYVAKSDDAKSAWLRRSTPKIDDSAFVVNETDIVTGFKYTPPKSGFNKIINSTK